VRANVQSSAFRAILLLLLAAGLRVVPVAQAPPAIRWAWSGAVTAHGATVKARVSAPGSTVTLTATREDADAATPLVLTATADPDGVVDFDLAGLQPRAAYTYRVAVPSGATMSGRFRTFADGPMDVTIAFASCAKTGSSSRVFDAIRAADPDVFVHMGDFHYRNIRTNDAHRFRRAYDAVLASRTQAHLYRSVPVAYVWDDHDYGGNNADGTATSRPAALDVYRQAVPHYPLASNGVDGIYQAFDIGRVRVIVTDARSRRSPSDQSPASARTMLGAAQRQWLFDQFTAAADRPLVVWVSSVPWIAEEASGPDHWGAYAAERRAIATHLDRVGLTRRLVMLSGDAHMVALDDGSHSHYGDDPSQGRGFIVAHAAPLDRFTTKKGGPYSHGISKKSGQFGLLTITDGGGPLQVEVTGRDKAGLLIPGMRIAMTCDGVRDCTVEPATPP
jgi:phosphodiesterase/alkaline phosphatase D-like protein